MVFGHEIAYHIAVVGEMPPNDERRILKTYQRYSGHYKSYMARCFCGLCRPKGRVRRDRDLGSMMRRGGLTYGHAPLFTTGPWAGATILLTQVVFLFVNVIFILKVH